MAKTAKPLTDSKIIKSWIPEVDKVMCPKKVRLYKQSASLSMQLTSSLMVSVKILLHTYTKRCPKLTPTPQKTEICLTQGTFIIEYIHINIIQGGTQK
jgi:hypothetical protein